MITAPGHFAPRFIRDIARIPRFGFLWMVSGILLGAMACVSTSAAEPALSATSSSSPPANAGTDDKGVQVGAVRVDPATRSLHFPARLNMTNGTIEYALVTEYGKTHESLLVTDLKPHDLQAALLLLSAQPVGTNGLRQLPKKPSGRALVNVRVAWQEKSDRKIRDLADLVALVEGSEGSITGKLSRGPWLFNGSMITVEGFAAHFEGSLISLITDPVAILNNPRPDRDDDEIHVPAADVLPQRGSMTEVIIEVPRSPLP